MYFTCYAYHNAITSVIHINKMAPCLRLLNEALDWKITDCIMRQRYCCYCHEKVEVNNLANVNSTRTILLNSQQDVMKILSNATAKIMPFISC